MALLLIPSNDVHRLASKQSTSQTRTSFLDGYLALDQTSF